MKIEELQRKNIRELQPYSCARDEFEGEAAVFLDANESPYNPPYNRYPDPLQWEVKKRISHLKKVDKKQIFLGNGSDEAIDILYRAFCEPTIDNVVAIHPSYGMYKVCADINNVEYRTVLLDDNFQITADSLLEVTDKNSKIVWLCSPNNPTGNSLKIEEVKLLLKEFPGIVVVDEAYIDFSRQPSLLTIINEYPRLVVLQTFSKAWGNAAVRLGMAFAQEEIISILNKIKYPYNINSLTQQHILETLDNRQEEVERNIEKTLWERTKMVEELGKMPFVQHLYPTDANFVLIKVEDPNGVYQQLVESGIIVRNRNSVTRCEGCLRITIGSENENKLLLEELVAIGDRYEKTISLS